MEGNKWSPGIVQVDDPYEEHSDLTLLPPVAILTSHIFPLPLYMRTIWTTFRHLVLNVPPTEHVPSGHAISLSPASGSGMILKKSICTFPS